MIQLNAQTPEVVAGGPGRHRSRVWRSHPPILASLVIGGVSGLFAGGAVAAVQLWQGMMAVGLAGGGAASPGLGLTLLLATLLGAGFGAVQSYRIHGYAAAVGSGILLGLIWWIVTSLTVQPLLAGAPVTWSLSDGVTAFPFLISGTAYGAVMGLLTHVGMAAYVRRWPYAAAGAARPSRRVVILGGGFGGISAAQRLERRLARRQDVEVVLVSDSNYMLFTPMLAEVAAGALHASHISPPLRAMGPNTTIYRARAEAIDSHRKVVQLRPTEGEPIALGYDHLVLALGAVPNHRGLPGVAEHSFSLKTLADAVALRNHVIGTLEHAELDPSPLRRISRLTYLVAGAGFAGAELIAELFDMVHDVRRYYPRIDVAELRFVLVHSGDRILPELSASLADYSRRNLETRGIEVILSTRITGASPDEVSLSNGMRIPTQTLVWTAGNQPNPLFAATTLPRTDAGAVACDSTMRIWGEAATWAVGDCAAIPDPDQPGRFQPPTAQHALREGTAVADNIVAVLNGRHPKPFRFRTLGQLVALGHQQGAAEVRGVRFSGMLAWLMWRGVYLAKLPGLEKKVRVTLDWLLDLFFPRDVVLTRSQREPSVRQSVEPSGVTR